MRDEQCGESYPHHGDIRVCRLALWHDDLCETANHKAFVQSLEQRAQQARDAWL